MTQQEIDELVDHGERVYQERHKESLEKTHHGWFCTIEPVSGRYYLGSTMNEAALAARLANPGKRFYTLRIGYPVAVELGAALA